MCLDNVQQTLTPLTLIECGWKEFNGYGRDLKFQAYPYKGSSDVPLDQWITAEEKPAEGFGKSHKYTAGFHIYYDERETLKNRGSYRRVYFRNVHTRGTQSAMTIVIAREMYVPSDPDAWPPRS